MAAFDPAHGHGAGAGPDLEDMLAQMFGMGGGMPPGFGGPGPQRTRKGADEEHPYQVSLEDLYKGKTTKFASTKNVICSHCKGSGGKEKAKAKQCASCQGKGMSGHSNTVLVSRLMRKFRLQGRVQIRGPWYGYSGADGLQLMQRQG